MWNLHECMYHTTPTARRVAAQLPVTRCSTTFLHAPQQTNRHYTPHLPLQAHIMRCLLKGPGLPQSRVGIWVEKRRLWGLLFAISVKFSVRMWKMLHRGINSLNHYTTRIKGWSNYFFHEMSFFSHLSEWMWTTCLLVWHHWCSSIQKYAVWNGEMIFTCNFILFFNFNSNFPIRVCHLIKIMDFSAICRQLQENKSFGLLHFCTWFQMCTFNHLPWLHIL